MTLKLGEALLESILLIPSDPSDQTLKKLKDDLVERFPEAEEELIQSAALMTGRRVLQIERDRLIRQLFKTPYCKKIINPLDKIDEYLASRGPRRLVLPSKSRPCGRLWPLWRTRVGDDILDKKIPLKFCEPMTMLQRLAEEFEYSYLLDRAAACENVLEQLALVSVFAITAYSSVGSRLRMPFMPLVGETYELNRSDDLGWRFMSEHISSYPPTSVTHCQSSRWEFWKKISFKSLFRGMYLKMRPDGLNRLLFKTGTSYTWNFVETTLNNIIFGKMWMDIEGEMEITEYNFGYKATVEFVPFDNDCADNQRRVRGVVMDQNGSVKWTIDGKRDTFITIEELKDNCDSETQSKKSEIVWSINEIPISNREFFNFGPFASQLNQFMRYIPPTDSRKRKDILKMERGCWQQAEYYNREISKINISSKVIPVWFVAETDPVTKEVFYQLKKVYWENKCTKKWPECPFKFS